MESMSYAPWIAGSAAPDLDLPLRESGPERRKNSDGRPRLYVLPTPPSAESADRDAALAGERRGLVRPPARQQVRLQEPAQGRPLERRVAQMEEGRRAEACEQAPSLLASPEAMLDLAVRALGAVVILLALILAGLVVGQAFAPEPPAAITVMPGDTLYSIASGIEGAPSIGTAVEDLMDLNVLGSDRLSVGQKLLVPEY